MFLKIIKIMPINYNLKSELEKKSIINSYKIFLKTCNFPIQILIQSKKENLDDHILKIQKNIEKNKKIEDIGKEYIKYIKSINLSKKSSTKEFYIVINNEKNNTKNNIEIEEIIKNELNEKYFKIKECLSRCGNSVQEILFVFFPYYIYYFFYNRFHAPVFEKKIERAGIHPLHFTI